MTGGGTQLSLQGSQDKYLYHKAVHSYFTSHHKTFENFAIESMQLTAQGQVDFGRIAVFTITGNAELICGAAVEILLPALTAPQDQDVAWIHQIGFYIFKKIEFKAQSQLLDTQYPQYLDLWTRLSVDASKREGFNDLIGEINFHNRLIDNHAARIGVFSDNAPQVRKNTKPQIRLLVPLYFWWCLDYSQAIPIGVLMYVNLQVWIEFRTVTECYVSSAALASQPSIIDVKLYVDYVFLDDAARNRIARDAAFYVFKQTQHPGPISVDSTTVSYRLPFVMPVCHLMLAVQEDDAVAPNVRRYDWYDRYNGNPDNLPDEPIELLEIKLSSQRRLEPRGYLYHCRYQPYKHHTSIPSTRGLYAYSFALHPEQSDASGAANFSRSENNYVVLTFNNSGGNGIGPHTGTLYIFATNYNYLYIESGFLTMLYNA